MVNGFGLLPIFVRFRFEVELVLLRNVRTEIEIVDRYICFSLRAMLAINFKRLSFLIDKKINEFI